MGEMEANWKADSVKVRYDLRFSADVDSLALVPPVVGVTNSVLYRSGQTTGPDRDSTDINSDGHVRLGGSVAFPVDRRRKRNVMWVREYLHDVSNGTGDRRDFAYEQYGYARNRPVFSEQVGLGIGGYDKTGGALRQVSSRSGTVPAVVLGFFGMAKYYTLGMDLRVQGESETKFGFIAGGLGGRWYPYGRLGTHPVFSLTIDRISLEAKEEDVLYRELEWGARAGVGIESNFETFTYSYSSGLGGVHTADILLLTDSDAYGWKIGTMYSVNVGRDFRTVSIQFYGEGSTKKDWPMVRYNDRPLWHRILASVTVAPFAAMAEGLRAIGLMRD